MNKIMDYLHWRGDLRFSSDRFNDIDALILALLSYIPFNEIVPGLESNHDITLKEAARLFFARSTESKDKSPIINSTASSDFNSKLVNLLKISAQSNRFARINLSKFEDNVDLVVGRQFAALTFSFRSPEPLKVIAFRGTDSSVVGWKEDFELAYKEQIPAQETACIYLERAIGLFTSPFIVCGHSKGGNLAIYAGSHLNIIRQGKLQKIINFDGPGFDFSLVQREDFVSSESKVTNYVPEESMVGLLLEPVGERKVVSSSGRFILQHDAFNWDVEITRFSETTLSSSATLMERTLKTWLTEIPIPQREAFLEALFDILGASEGAIIKFDPQENIKEIKNILVKYAKLDLKTKTLLTQVSLSLTSQTTKTLTNTIKEKIPKLH